MTSTIEQRVRDLQDYIASGRVLEAMEEFYAEDVVMQENLNEPCAGRSANVAREREWLETVKEFRSFEVLALGTEGDVSFVESAMSYLDRGGNEVSLTQVSRARWEDGRIVHERFYHG